MSAQVAYWRVSSEKFRYSFRTGIKPETLGARNLIVEYKFYYQEFELAA